MAGPSNHYVFDACALIAFLNADSFALALAAQLDASLISTDHHEFDDVEKSGEVKFFWLR